MKRMFKFVYDKYDDGIYRIIKVFGIKFITKPLELKINELEHKLEYLINNSSSEINSAINNSSSEINSAINNINSEIHNAINNTKSSFDALVLKQSQDIINTISPLIVCRDLEQPKQELIDNNIPFVSSIIAVYNLGGKYLRPCLESIVNQTLKNIEIIIVNDASPNEEDERICLEYAAKDSRIKYIKHEKNIGSGGARMTGLKEAKGKYIHFVDGDDFLALHAYDLLFAQMITTNVDIISFGYYHFNDDLESVGFNQSYHEYKVPYLMYGEDIFKAFANGYISPCLWAKFYSHEFLKQFGYDFVPEKIRAQDLAGNSKVFFHAKSLLNLSINLYYYRFRTGSKDTTISENYVSDIRDAFFNMRDYFAKEDIDYKYMLIMMAMNIQYTYSQIRKFTKDTNIEKFNYYVNLLSVATNEIIDTFNGKIDRKELYERFKYYDMEIANWYEDNILF